MMQLFVAHQHSSASTDIEDHFVSISQMQQYMALCIIDERAALNGLPGILQCNKSAYFDKILYVILINKNNTSFTSPSKNTLVKDFCAHFESK